MKKLLAVIAAAILSIVAIILGTYFFWASNLIWVIVPASAGYISLWYFLLRKKDRKEFLEDIAYRALLVWVALVLCILSTFVQYWASTAVLLRKVLFSLETWMVVGTMILILAITAAYKWLTSRLAQKKQKREAAARKAEAEKQLQIAQQQEAEKIENLLKQESVSFKELIGIKKVPNELILKANFFDLIEISDLKQKIKFSPLEIQIATDLLEPLFRDSYDDKVLRELQKKFNFQRIKDYTGFDALKNKIQAHTNEDFQKFIGL